MTSLTLVPPSPVTDQITLDIRGALRNPESVDRVANTAIYLDETGESRLLHRETVPVRANSTAGIRLRWPTQGHAGRHEIILLATVDNHTIRAAQPVEILASDIRSTRRIDGAWTGIYHWSEAEGRLWNHDIRNMADADWRELVRGMHRIGMDIIVVQEVFRNQMYVGQHTIEKDGYEGCAFYPSKLFPGRMPVAAKDPIEAILSEADVQRMHVFLGVGLYAWFDFTPASLEWHKAVAAELHEMYGHHPSFYGWYVSEEAPGSLDNWAKDKAEQERRKSELVEFFRSFTPFCHRLAPDMPVMLATNCHNVPAGEDTYPALIENLDILCPFGFARMPQGDISGEDAAARLQKFCDDAGSHLWMDMEVFLFHPDNALYPRPISGLLDDLLRFPNFEKIICYQVPGLLNAPDARLKPGGRDTVKLYEDYATYLRDAWRR